jgi:hypothetical protein
MESKTEEENHLFLNVHKFCVIFHHQNCYAVSLGSVMHFQPFLCGVAVVFTHVPECVISFQSAVKSDDTPMKRT